MSERKPTLRDMAITQNREKLFHGEKVDVAEPFLLVIGSEKSGKTSLINQILQSERIASSEPPSTYLLDYKCGRKSDLSLVKNDWYMWELGSGRTFVSLISVIVKSRQPTLVALVLDLMSSGMMVKTAETLLNTLKSQLLKSSTDEKSMLNSNDPEDRIFLQPFPVPLVIIGGKYDVFQNLEPAKKRITCQYLRCLAHALQADLLFYSKSDNKLVKNARNILLQRAFGISADKNNIITDYNKPLSIPAGHDSISSIEGSPVTSVDQVLSKYRNSLLTSFNPDSNQQQQMPDDPGNDPNFIERAIDDLCAQKEKELSRIQSESQKKAAAVDLLRDSKVPKH